MSGKVRSIQFHDVSRLLAPRSLAVIGASDQPGNLGGVAIRLLRKFGYPGDIWPVNPRRDTVGELRCYPSVDELPKPADMAIIATGAETTPDLVRACAKVGITCGIVWAGGFIEVGSGGAALQSDLMQACRDTGFTLVGPNCIGVINSWLPMTASFASFLVEADNLVRGNISMVSQSGGIATMGQALAQRAGFGFRYMISSGNEAVVTAADYIHALVQDPHTKVIAAYLEGVSDGDKFLAALDEARSAGKPVIVLKGGATTASARAAAAHTGSLVGEERVWNAVLREMSVIQAQSLEQLLDIALFLSSTDLDTLPAGPGVVAVTFGGGSGVLSADQCAREGLETPPLSDATRTRLQPLVPPIASTENPIDLTPQTFNQAAWFEQLPEALDVIAADPSIDIILLQFGPMAQRGAELAELAREFRLRTRKTVCMAWPLAPKGIDERLRQDGIYVFQEYARAIATMGRIVGARHARSATAFERLPPIAFDWSRFVPKPTPGLIISEHDCHALLDAAGLAVAAGRLAVSEEQAIEAADAVGFPVALKGISPAVTHRAAAGLLALRIESPGEVREAYRRLVDHAAGSGISLDGIYVQHMVRGDLEILISAFRDPVFGVMVSCGTGGTLTEIIDDVTLERAPFDEARAFEIITRLRIARGARKIDPQADLHALAHFLARFSRLVADCPWRRFVIEVNPVKWGAPQVTAVDGLMIIEEP